MRQLVKRKQLTGDYTPFTFSQNCTHFLVKNFTSNPVYVSFEPNTPDDEAVKISSMMAESMAISFSGENNPKFAVDTIYVKGVGEVEVEALELYVE